MQPSRLAQRPRYHPFVLNHFRHQCSSRSILCGGSFLFLNHTLSSSAIVLIKVNCLCLQHYLKPIQPRVEFVQRKTWPPEKKMKPKLGMQTWGWLRSFWTTHMCLVSFSLGKFFPKYKYRIPLAKWNCKCHPDEYSCSLSRFIWFHRIHPRL